MDKTIIKASFRERLQQLQADMTITDFAKIIGLTRQTAGFYLNGDRIPDIATLAQICERCNVSADYLLGFTPNPTTDQNASVACAYTGLSQKSIELLHGAKEYGVGGDLTPIADRLLIALFAGERKE